MLTLKAMIWDNCFSYGDNNYIKFDQTPLTQLVGSNGSGKTSISLMIQEALYGKNNKNIRKQDISNNKSGKKGYRIQLEFEKDGDDYLVDLNRKSNLKFRLYKNDEDISSHTSLNTYKTLSEIIGVADFKVFCQLIYQHGTESLEFLTATDTNRKKFLISLLQLDRYLELHEHFKEKVKIINSEVATLLGSIGTIEAWINKHESINFEKKSLLPIDAVPDTWRSQADKISQDIININSINRKIATNNEYLKALSELDEKYYMGSAPVLKGPNSAELRGRIRVLNSQHDHHQNKINQLSKTTGECPTCLQEVDEYQKDKMLDTEISLRDAAQDEMDKLYKEAIKVETLEAEIKKYKTEKTEFERLSQLIDYKLKTKTLDLNQLQSQLNNLHNQINQVETNIKTAQTKNLEISAHNSKIEVIKNQLVEMRDELKAKDVLLAEKENLLNVLELLKKTFSTNGLVSYKIESSVKELERKINEYLAELTYFQMYFKLSGEKLNLQIIDDKNNEMSIANLSSGERARLNLACVLSIRSILASLTNTKINLLFLDEITGSLDAEGKEKFTEILLREKLNSFFVSHEWTHPLVPQINIVKEHGISRIEND